MPNMKSLSLMVQKLWPRLNFFLPQNDRQTITDRTKTRCCEFYSGDIKTSLQNKHQTVSLNESTKSYLEGQGHNVTSLGGLVIGVIMPNMCAFEIFKHTFCSVESSD